MSGHTRRRNTRRITCALAAIALPLAVALDAAADISDSKRKLIEELLAISGYADMASQMAEQQSYVELMRIRMSYRPMMEFAVSEQTDLSDDEKQQLLEKLADFDAFAEEFRTRFQGRVNFGKIIEEVYYPLYDESFSEDDLKEMVAFYRTKVGRKTIQRMPAIMQNATQAIDRLVRPESIGVIQNIVADARENLGN